MLNIPEIEIGDRVKVKSKFEGEDDIIGIVGDKFERHHAGWDGIYIKVYDPVTNGIRCTTIIDEYIELL